MKRNPKLKFLIDQFGHEYEEANGMNQRALDNFRLFEAARLLFHYNW